MESIEVMPIRTRITSILKKAIYSGEYKDGQELSLTSVAEQLGVSRTPVREAFQALESEGLITLRMNKGAIVNKIDDKFIRDHFEMRMLLESEAAAKAAVNGMETADLLARLERIRPETSMDRSEYEELNQDIHMAVWKAADNRKLQNYLMELWNGPSTGHSVSDAQSHYHKSTEEHLALLHAIRSGDIESSRSIMRTHILRSQENVLRALHEYQE